MKIIITGAGIAGLTNAIAIRKFRPDIELEIFESAPALKAAGAGLALGANAILGFEQLGIEKEVLAVSNLLETFSILDENGRVVTKTDSIALNRKLQTVSNFAVHRAALQEVLLEKTGGIPVHLGKEVWDFREKEGKVFLRFGDCSEAAADYVIAADGIHSIFRQMLVPESKIRFAGYTCWRGVTENPPAGLDSRQASETWGLGKRFGIVPMPGGLVYWFACLNACKMKDEHFAAFGKHELAEEFQGFHRPVQNLILSTPQDKMLWNDIIDFQPLKRFAFERVLLTGDAAHATTPNMGQGACQAIESAVVLGKILSKTATPQDAFKQFEQRRIKRTSMIVNRSLQLGKIAQVKNPLLAGARNALFRLLPESLNERQIRSLLDVQFD